MNRDSADGTELLDLADLQLTITGADTAWACGWYEPGLGWVEEIVYPDHTDRWENGRQVPA